MSPAHAHGVRGAVPRLIAFTILAYLAYLAYDLVAGHAARVCAALMPNFS